MQIDMSSRLSRAVPMGLASFNALSPSTYVLGYLNVAAARLRGASLFERNQN